MNDNSEQEADDMMDARVEAWIKQYQRKQARYRRLFSYKIRRIRDNDPTLTDVDVHSGDVIPPLLKALERNTTILRFEVACVSLPSILVEKGLGRVLRYNSTLTLLRLTHCNVHPSGVAALFQCLTKNTTLRTLDLSCNPRLFFDHDNSSNNNNNNSRAISRALPQMKGLQSLKLCSTGLTSAALKVIFEGLRRNTTLQSFDVSENAGIGLELANCLVQNLAHLNALQILLVHSTGFSDVLDQHPELMASLSSAMAKNMSLWKLDYIILHKVEQYKSKEEQVKQRRCLEILNEIEWYKVRNGLFSCNTLTLTKRELWPSILARAGTSGTPYSADLVFCILQAKCDGIFQVGQADSSNAEQDNACESPKGYAKKMKPTRPIKVNRRTKYSKRQLLNRHGETDSSGFCCKIHQRTRMVPTNCCPFESIIPITITAPHCTQFPRPVGEYIYPCTKR